jgi:hypothetical protein
MKNSGTGENRPLVPSAFGRHVATLLPHTDPLHKNCHHCPRGSWRGPSKCLQQCGPHAWPLCYLTLALSTLTHVANLLLHRDCHHVLERVVDAVLCLQQRGIPLASTGVLIIAAVLRNRIRSNRWY